MNQVHDWLHEFLASRASVGLEIILSDTSVPGEGEHKIMDIIRSLIAQKVYDDNTHHMFYGLDADLVFLGLATTTKYFTVLRDSHVYVYCRGCGIPEHPTYECVKKSARSGHIICISKIPPQTENKVLVDLFSSCGEIRRFLADYTPERYGFMFIDYKEPSAAASALQGGWMLNGKALSVVYAEFDILLVSFFFFCYLNSFLLFILNIFSLDNIVNVSRIPPNTTDEDLIKMFTVFGEIKHVCIKCILEANS